MKTAQYIKNSQKGFTLIELLVVIGILAILLAIVLIAINPARQFAQANDTKRASDVNSVLNAVNQYMADNHGTLPSASTLNATNCTSAAPCTITNDSAVSTPKVDLCAPLVTKYIADLPIDPTAGTRSYTTGDCTQASTTYNTGYKIWVSGNDNRITVTATSQINPSTPISVTR
jgi:type IV pilus assembly protein PilA